MFFQRLAPFLAALLFLTAQVSAKTTSHIAYVSAWTGEGLAESINDELDRIQTANYNNNKFFEYVKICMSPPDYAYILYNVSDRMGETNPLITKVAYTSGWFGGTIADGLQDTIKSLQDSAFYEGKLINILDIDISPNMGYAYIIYEISK